MSKKQESDPISDDELLVRRVRVEKFNNTRIPIISPTSFEPRVKGHSPDTKGISLYRLDCLENASVALDTISDETKRQQTGVVSIQVLEVRAVRAINLTVTPSPDTFNSIPGHVVIKELNSIDWPTQKEQMKLAAFELAVFASEKIAFLSAHRV